MRIIHGLQSIPFYDIQIKCLRDGEKCLRKLMLADLFK